MLWRRAEPLGRILQFGTHEKLDAPWDCRFFTTCLPLPLKCRNILYRSKIAHKCPRMRPKGAFRKYNIADFLFWDMVFWQQLNPLFAQGLGSRGTEKRGTWELPVRYLQCCRWGGVPQRHMCIVYTARRCWFRAFRGSYSGENRRFLGHRSSVFWEGLRCEKLYL